MRELADNPLTRWRVTRDDRARARIYSKSHDLWEHVLRETSIAEAASEFADYLIDGLDRSVATRENGTVSPDRIVDVQFSAFMADPLAAVRTIYDRLGLELTADAEARMRAFLAAHPQEEHGRHRYRFADTGLDPGEWRERTRRYQEYFDVPSEP